LNVFLKKKINGLNNTYPYIKPCIHFNQKNKKKPCIHEIHEKCDNNKRNIIHIILVTVAISQSTLTSQNTSSSYIESWPRYNSPNNEKCENYHKYRDA